MRLRAIAFCLLLIGFTEIVFAQHAVDPAQRYHRLICLVHLTGSGKSGDPVIPEYAPVAASAVTAASPAPATTSAAVPSAGSSASSTTAPPIAVASAPRPGILAWSSQITDDGKMAIVQYVAADRGAFASILADTRPEIRIFEIGVNSRAQIETEMQKYKKNFNLDELTLRVR